MARELSGYEHKEDDEDARSDNAEKGGVKVWETEAYKFCSSPDATATRKDGRCLDSATCSALERVGVRGTTWSC